ncbi:MAG: flagellar filament capping protein FliD [Christensenellales bacterium]|jgi:flagellar hook-associated protein 2
MSISSLNRSTLRLTGLQSGFDTEAVVKSMLYIDQLKVDKQYKATTKIEWKEDAYRDINLKLKTFRETYMSALSDQNVFSSSAYNIFRTESLNDTGKVKVSANAQAQAGVVRINQVSQLAEAAKASGLKIFTDQKDGVSLDTKLKDAQFANPLAFENGFAAFSINGVGFTFTEDSTLNDMVNAVNNQYDKTGVKMAWSSLTQSFTFTEKATGADSSLIIGNLMGNLFGEGEGAPGALGIETGTYTGKNAKLTINGIEVERSTNSFTIDGISYTLNGTSDTEMLFSIERDIDATLDKLSAFVDAYNELVSGLQSLLNEKVNRSYAPLTEEERASLSDAEIENWEKEAKSGLLRNDTYVSSLLSSLRGAFYDVVESANKSAADVGLKTSSNFQDILDGAGKIELDRYALRQALENDPDAVTNLFMASSSAQDPATVYRESGLMTRLYDAMTVCTKSINEQALPANTRSLNTAKDRLAELQDWIYTREERYWSQFTAMEAALSSLNSQTSWISAMLGQLNQ